MKNLLALTMIVFCLAVAVVFLFKKVTLTQDCTGYLKRAADASTVETAKSEIAKSIAYLEKENITSGYTSVLWRTPNEDIGFWYGNLKSLYAELDKVDGNTSSLEKTNLLMKLRETLLDNGEDGDRLTIPNGLSLYPNNIAFGALGWSAIIVFALLCAWGAVKFDEYP